MSGAERRGAGDRWLAGERVDGVAFVQHQAVELVGGSRDGTRGRVLLLMQLGDDPAYVVKLETGQDVRVRQSALRALE